MQCLLFIEEMVKRVYSPVHRCLHTEVTSGLKEGVRRQT